MQGSYVKYKHSVTEFEFFTAESTTRIIPVFKDMIPCSTDLGYECFEGKSCLHSQCRSVEYGGITFLQNVGTYVPHYISSHSTRPYLRNPVPRYTNTSV
jgi:hypothetical protein